MFDETCLLTADYWWLPILLGAWVGAPLGYIACALLSMSRD